MIRSTPGLEQARRARAAPGRAGRPVRRVQPDRAAAEAGIVQRLESARCSLASRRRRGTQLVALLRAHGEQGRRGKTMARRLLPRVALGLALVGVLVGALGALAAAPAAVPAADAQGAELTVFAAASLADAFDELGSIFES